MEAAFREEKGALKENVDVLISTLGFFLQQPDTYAEDNNSKRKKCGTVASSECDHLDRMSGLYFGQALQNVCNNRLACVHLVNTCCS